MARKPDRRTSFRLSEVERLDVDSLRPESMDRARAHLRAYAAGSGALGRVHVDVYGKRIVLGDGRHRVLAAKELGFSRLPAMVTVYGPRGARLDRYVADLVIGR